MKSTSTPKIEVTKVAEPLTTTTTLKSTSTPSVDAAKVEETIVSDTEDFVSYENDDIFNEFTPDKTVTSEREELYEDFNENNNDTVENPVMNDTACLRNNGSMCSPKNTTLPPVAAAAVSYPWTFATLKSSPLLLLIIEWILITTLPIICILLIIIISLLFKLVKQNEMTMVNEKKSITALETAL